MRSTNCSVKRARQALKQKSPEGTKSLIGPASSGSSITLQADPVKQQLTLCTNDGKIQSSFLQIPTMISQKRRSASCRDISATVPPKRTSFHSDTVPYKSGNLSSSDCGGLASKSTRRLGLKAALKALNPLTNLTSGSARRKNEDNLAIIFMGIILIFLICHFPRIINSLYEVATIHKSLLCAKARKPQFSLWSLMMISISHVLLVFNSATNMLVYCLLSSKFRSECVRHLSCLTTSKKIVGNNVSNDRDKRTFWVPMGLKYFSSRKLIPDRIIVN